MKLKKIASLMLAGVMAISMLAGCSNGNGGNDGETVVVPSDMTGKVIAALDEDTTEKVTFSASSSLQSTLETAVEYCGSTESIRNSNVLNAMKKIDNNLKSDYIPALAAVEANDKKVQSSTQVFVLDANSIGANDAYISNSLANQIETAQFVNNVYCADLPEQTGIYGNTAESSKNHWYNFEYTGDVAVVAVTDAVNGKTTYVAAVTVTRTPTMVEQ